MGDADRQLVVFADDWGRHPSSAQHLIRHLLPAWTTLWVNTVGTRRPRWSDLNRAWPIVAKWFVPHTREQAGELPSNLRVIAPKMYPGFRSGWQRRLNARLLTRAVGSALRSPSSAGGAERGAVALTTLPITADLVGKIPGIDRWVYYCVDDFSAWPGLDGDVMDAMERALVAKVDAIVAVSGTLTERIRSMGRDDVTLVTHGVDLNHWRVTHTEAPQVRAGLRAPDYLFWGLIDERMDGPWLSALMEEKASEIVLAGPQQNVPMGVRETPARLVGAVPWSALPAMAATARVLIMPYVDAPVTRAMQPLKLKEYLATYKPVVVRDLPATREWADCCDLVSTAEDFVRLCLERAETGLPESQRIARERRLPAESWSAKAAQLESLLRAAT